MPITKFTAASRNGPKLEVRGIVQPPELMQSVETIRVVVIALDDPERRDEKTLSVDKKQKLNNNWVLALDNTPAAGAPFQDKEVVVLVGALEGLPFGGFDPVLWHGFFRIQPLTDPRPSEVTLHV
jgi:hypothetical protein